MKPIGNIGLSVALGRMMQDDGLKQPMARKAPELKERFGGGERF